MTYLKIRFKNLAFWLVLTSKKVWQNAFLTITSQVELRGGRWYVCYGHCAPPFISIPSTACTFLTQRPRVGCHLSSNTGPEFEILDIGSLKDFDFNFKVNGEGFNQWSD